MSKAWYLTAALSGVHTMWRAKPQNAGYDGPRVEEGMFNNGYYKAMLNYGWVPQKGVCGNPDKNQWSRIDSLKGVHGHRTGEMMQDSDMCLAYGFKDGSRLSAAESERCCMWTDWRLVFNEKITAADFPPVSSLDDKATGGVYPPEEVIVPEVALPTDYCGFKSSPSLVSADPDSLAEHWCCREHAADERGVLDENNDVRHCNDPKFQSNHGPAFYAVHKFAKDESAWLNAFMEAWWIGTTNGYDHKLHFLRPPTTVPYFVPQESCRLLPSEKECADAGCAWAGSLCSAGTEFSWGVVWNELSMLSREQPPEPPEPSEPPEPPEPPAASDYDRSDDANRHILKADTACAKCAPHKNDNTNCCAFGGAWEGMCDEGGQHTWSEGFRVCNSPEADYIAATGEPLSSSDEETVEAMRESAVAAANAAAAAAAAAGENAAWAGNPPYEAPRETPYDAAANAMGAATGELPPGYDADSAAATAAAAAAAAIAAPLSSEPISGALAPTIAPALAPSSPAPAKAPTSTSAPAPVTAACGLCGRNPDHINAPNCCSVGGAWEGLCDEGGQHTWSEGFHACNSPGANNVAAPAPAVKETREPFYPRPPPGKVTVHGDPMFKHDGIGLKFSIPLHKPTELLGWRGKRGEAVSLLGTAYERENSKHTQWFNSFALTVDGRELFNVSTFGSQREQLSPHGSLRLVVDGKVHTVSPEDVANFATIIHPDTSLTLSMLAKKFRIGNKRAQSLKVRTTGNVTFSVYSSGATKYQDKKEQYKYRHLNVRLDSGMPDGATGIFAQMAGVVPMTPATRKMLSAPKRFDALMKRQRKHRVRAQKGRKVRAIAPDEAW